MRTPLAIFILSATSVLVHAEDNAPWMEQRSMEKFQVLLTRSPFSLPTAEESAPMADRFFLTGAATINNTTTCSASNRIPPIINSSTTNRKRTRKT